MHSETKSASECASGEVIVFECWRSLPKMGIRTLPEQQSLLGRLCKIVVWSDSSAAT